MSKFLMISTMSVVVQPEPVPTCGNLIDNIDGEVVVGGEAHTFMLPGRIYTIENENAYIHGENLIIVEEFDESASFNYRYELSGNTDIKSTKDGDIIVLNVPSSGERRMEVYAGDMASTTLVVTVAQTASAPYTVLMMGDSLTNAAVYPAKVQELISSSGGVVDERGTPGKTWAWHRDDVSSSVSDISTLDVTPDIVVWALGTNGIATAYTSSAYDAYEQVEVDAAISLITDPNWAAGTKHVVVYAPPANGDYDSFESLDGQNIGSLVWARQKNHRINREYLATLNLLPSVYVAPVYLDRIQDYPINNYAHPDTGGYNKMGSQVAAAVLYAIQDTCDEE